jgi:hypothetical protein
MRFTAFLLTLLLAGFSPQDEKEASGVKLDDYYKFPVGTKWTLLRKAEGQPQSKVELEVTKVEDGVTYYDSREFDEGSDKPKKTDPMAWHVKDGHLIWAQVKDGKLNTLFKVLKEGAKAGDSWEGGGEGLPFTVTATLKEITTLPTPAGEYKNAAHVLFEMKMEQQVSEMSFYFAPGVGLLRLGGEGPAGKGYVELAEFKKGGA